MQNLNFENANFIFTYYDLFGIPQGRCIQLIFLLNISEESMKSIQKIFTVCFNILAYIMIASPHMLEASNSNGGLFSLTTDTHGNFVSVWGENVNGIPKIKSSTLSSNGQWSDPVIISLPGTFSVNPQVKTDDLGNAVALWKTNTKDKPNYYLEAAMLPIGGLWSTPVTISNPNEHITSGDVILEVSGNGNIVAMWGVYTEDRVVIKAARAQFGGTWSTPVRLNEL